MDICVEAVVCVAKRYEYVALQCRRSDTTNGILLLYYLLQLRKAEYHLDKVASYDARDMPHYILKRLDPSRLGV